MQTPPDALVTREASIDIEAAPESVYDLVADIGRTGEWSPENLGGQWINGGAGQQGDWFEGVNKSGDRVWTRPCEVARADRGRDFTFVVDGVEKNCTWWSYEMAALEGGGTRLTERWWIVNKTPAMAAATDEELKARVEFTETMLQDSIAAIKAIAES